MPFIPHTEQDISSMLKRIGADTLDDLFDEIPANLRCGELDKVPTRMSEMEVSRLMQSRADTDTGGICFIGAGAYEHHIPAAVWQITTRGEYYTAYTPYQAEASQGTLQLLYEFQSMMTALTGMETSNASLYDGASALAEAVLMSVRVNRKAKSKRILMPLTVHPTYRQVVHTLVKNQGIELIDVPYIKATGKTDFAALQALASDGAAAVVIPQPNFFGVIDDVDVISDWAADNKVLSIAVVNPMALAILKPPGEWGKNGVDITCGEGQPLGIPMSSGGPFYGFLCARKVHVRQMPGRIIGRTVDLDGKDGYALTLQAREQHIRRSKATSNICTNQGLMVTASTIYMALMGSEGLERTALSSHENTQKLAAKLTAIAGVEVLFSSAYFHEVVIKLNTKVDAVLSALADQNVLGGYDLSEAYPELGDALLVCATEMRSDAEIDTYAQCLDKIIAAK